MSYPLLGLLWKVDTGAEHAVTQPVFDTAQLWRFLEELEKRGLRIPIVAGIWPLVSIRNAEFLANEISEINVPAATVERMRTASERGKEHAVREGIAVAREIRSEVGGEPQGIQGSAPFGRVPGRRLLQLPHGCGGVKPTETTAN